MINKMFYSFILFLLIICCIMTYDSTAQTVNKKSKKEKKTMEVKNDTLTIAVIKTNMGTIELELFAKKAVKTVENFVGLAEKGYYNGVIFHRVIDNFMIQGGGFDKDYQQKPTRATIQNEAKNGLKNVKYSIAMARTSQPHSASAQFFINVKDNSFLDYPGQDGWGYAVFGKVVEGMDVVDKIKAVKTGRGGMFPTDVPQEMVIIEKVTVVDAK